MKRLAVSVAVAAALTLVAAGCSQNAFEQVAVTKESALVSGCQKVEEVSVPAKTPDTEVTADLSEEARRKGGNYVLVTADGARTGTAYRCTTPAAGAASTGR